MALVKLNNRGVKDISAVGSIGTGDLVFISKQTASSSASISFTSGLDSSYKEYIFYFVNLHPSTDSVEFRFNGSDDTSSHNYDITKTTTAYRALHNESDTTTGLAYMTGDDLAQSTSYQAISIANVGADNDQCANGFLHLFNPSSTTFVKHFMSQMTINTQDNFAYNAKVAGYFNTTSAITALDFKFASGNIDSGDIILYGVN
jgi:hypothetical protein